MNTKLRVLFSVFTVLLLALAPMAAMAQETSTSLRVNVTNSDGTPLAGASVLVTDTRNGATRNLTTSETGTVLALGMRIGGPYTVAVTAENAAGITVSEIMLNLGDTYILPLALGGATMEEVIVTAQQVSTMQLALGPSTTFGLEQMQDMPAINRDLRDIVRADPRLYLDPAFASGAISCAGANPRFNSLTVDGVRMNDNFGLNSNGYPTPFQPFSYDSIQEVAVELAPFDVIYGGFTACNINAVTKSGENEFHGSAFYDYTDDGMGGDSLEGDDLILSSFDEQRYGVTFGGPIIKDKLFFFLAYEKLEGFDKYERGPAGSGRAVEVQGVSQEQIDEIYDIARNIYDYDPGGFPGAIPIEDEKYTIKLDWNINEYHRMALTHNYNDGANISESDRDSDELEFHYHYYERGAELTATTAALFSNWTDRFSTEFRVSYSELINRQITIGPKEFGEVQIRTYNDHDGDGNLSRATIYLGADDSRQANKLNYDTTNWKLAGNYALDNHLLTFGYELDQINMFNLFLPHIQTENRFDEGCRDTNPNGCIDDFRLGLVNDIYYGATPSFDPNDAAVPWGYDINTLYFQDEFSVFDGDVTIVAGLRYDWYTSSDAPNVNQNYIDRYGFSNATTFDGVDLIQPRLGFSWEATDRVTVRGGIGLYSGGNPNVWLSNAFSNDGVTALQLRESSVIERGAGWGKGFSLFEIPISGDGRPIWNNPQDFIDAVATASSDSSVNATDPNFEPPSNWKFALGATWDMDWGKLGDGYILNADFLYTKGQDSANIVRNGAELLDETAPDGRPLYFDPRAGFPSFCFCSDFLLTNVKGSDSESLSLSLAIDKSHDNGWDWSVGYAYTDAEEVNPMTSSVAFSNFVFNSVSDFNDPGLATANYVVPHRITFRASYEANWWKDNRSKFSVFGSANEGRPYSYVFSNGDEYFGDWLGGRHLVYVPTGIDDPLVTFLPGFETDDFFAFVNSSGLSKYAGQIAPRNAFNSGWWTHLDFRFEQEFPGFSEDHRFSGFVVIKNLCNLINDDWCVLKEVGFPRRQSVVELHDDSVEDGKYLFDSFIQPAGETRVSGVSLYEIRVGLRYEF
jgi:outer membrane receptor for ferrienterochelin and colicin